MGRGPVLQFASTTVPENGRTFSASLTVSVGKLPEGNPSNGGPSGVYKLVTTVFLNSSIGGAGFDISGFAEGPVIRVEDPREGHARRPIDDPRLRSGRRFLSKRCRQIVTAA